LALAGRHGNQVPGRASGRASEDVLQKLHDKVPANHFTLRWLTDSPHTRSFGMIVLLLGPVAIAPFSIFPRSIAFQTPAFVAVWESVLGAKWLRVLR